MKRVLAVLLLLMACSPAEELGPAVAADPKPAVQCVNEWTRVGKGIEYRTLNCNLHLVRVDPKVANIDAVLRPGSTATTLGREFAYAQNANFFDERLRPLGVIVSAGKQVNALHPVSWQSVFLVEKDGTPRIVPVKQWNDVRDSASAAVQCGPRLVVAGKKNKVARANPTWRSGVCIDREKRVIFFTTPPDTQLDVHEMADLTATTLRCRDAMLFDGGPSTQMYLRREGGRAVVVEGDKRVPGYVVVR